MISVLPSYLTWTELKVQTIFFLKSKEIVLIERKSFE